MNTERTSLFLMANLGAEASRIISARERNDIDTSHAALERAEKILEQIKNLPEMKPRIKEIDALGEALRSHIENSGKKRISGAHLKSYFTPFATRMLANQRSKHNRDKNIIVEAVKEL